MKIMPIRGRQQEAECLKLRMGLSPDLNIDLLELRALWHRLCHEESRLVAGRARRIDLEIIDLAP